MFEISARTRSLIRQALREDIGRGDITTDTFVPPSLSGEGNITVKGEGILSGGPVVREVFRCIDPRLKSVQLVRDGTRVRPGRTVFKIRGRAASILKGERVALNFLGRLSGIATLTHQFVRQVRGTQAKILDTRKTTPLWRELEKYAVRSGGGQSHRSGLWDGILVKDNHWFAMNLSFPRKRESKVLDPRLKHSGMTRRMRLLRQRLDRYLVRRRTDPSNDLWRTMTFGKKIPIQVEVQSIEGLRHLLGASCCPPLILLDNFSIPDLKRAVRIVRRSSFGSGVRRPQLEASGGITLGNVRAIARTGVDRISIGALTHSVPVLDVSLKLEKVW